MTTLPAFPPAVNSTFADDLMDAVGPLPVDADAPAECEPAGPSAEDSRWAAENLNDDWHDLDGPEPDWDALAEDAAALDAYERGLIFA